MFSEEQLQAQREVAARIATKLTGEEPCYAHIGFFRNSPRGRRSNLGIRFYSTPDPLGQRLEFGVLWESVEVVDVGGQS